MQPPEIRHAPRKLAVAAPLAAEDGIDRGSGDAGPAGDGLDGGGLVAFFHDEPARGHGYALAGLIGLPLPDKGVVRTDFFLRH